jgi:hypothetical protein
MGVKKRMHPNMAHRLGFICRRWWGKVDARMAGSAQEWALRAAIAFFINLLKELWRRKIAPSVIESIAIVRKPKVRVKRRICGTARIDECLESPFSIDSLYYKAAPNGRHFARQASANP